MDSLDPLVEEKLIAQGNLNCIYKRTFESGRVDILKKIYNYREPYGVSGRTIREVSLLVDLKHENIISLNDVYVDRNESERPAVCMVFEAFPMSLAKFIRENAPVPEFTRWCLFEILKGVSYLHAEGVIHRDLKTDNILVDSVERVVKIADFGTARDVNVQPDSISSDVTSIHCRAIEMVYGCQNYTAAVDMWSLGCVFFELARGRPLFDNHDYFLSQRYPYDWEDGSYTGTYNVIQLYNQMVSYFGEPPLELLSPNMQSMHQMGVIGVRHGMTRDLQDEVGDLEENGRELLLMMLNIDPTARITATQALAHPYFDDIRS